MALPSSSSLRACASSSLYLSCLTLSPRPLPLLCSGHHCIDGNGYPKLLRSSAPRLEHPVSAQESAADPHSTAVAILRGARGLRLGLLPRHQFPPAFMFGKNAESSGDSPTQPDDASSRRASALVGRIVRPDKDPRRSHRLRLDRYDERDFDEMRSAMIAAGLWVLAPSEEAL